MKARKILCSACGGRMTRKHSYKKAWYNATHAYKTVYECECGQRLAILAMDENAFLADRAELLTRMHDAEDKVLEIASKLREYRDKTSLERLLMELDGLEKQINYVRRCVKGM